MQLLKLFQTEVEDRYSRENFSRLERVLRDSPIVKGEFVFFQCVVQDRGTFPKTLVLEHNLGFMPKDIILLSIASPDGEWIDWNYDDFTRTHVSFMISGACTVRALLGRYEEG